MPFTAAESAACQTLVHLALDEDLGPDWHSGDATSLALIPADREGSASLGFRTTGVLAGLPAVEMVLAEVDPRLLWQWAFADGERIDSGTSVGTIQGPLASLLRAERTLLNVLQHLSGIAT